MTQPSLRMTTTILAGIFGFFLSLFPPFLIAANVLEIAELISHPEQYDHQTVIIAGQVSNFQLATTRDGKPAADAMVFVSLADAAATTDALPEAAAVYEPASTPPGVYAQAKLPVPAGATECPVRFRIVLGESEQDWTRDIKIPLK